MRMSKFHPVLIHVLLQQTYSLVAIVCFRTSVGGVRAVETWIADLGAHERSDTTLPPMPERKQTNGGWDFCTKLKLIFTRERVVVHTSGFCFLGFPWPSYEYEYLLLC